MRLGNGPIDNGLNAFWIHCDAVGGDNKAEELGFLDVEFALLEFDIKAHVRGGVEGPFEHVECVPRECRWCR